MARPIDTKRDRLFLKLFKRGLTFKEISKALKNKSTGTIWARYKRLIREKVIN